MIVAARERFHLFALSMVLAVWTGACRAHDIDQLEADIRQISPARALDLDLEQVVNAYGLLGIQHILSGFDHLMFVVALSLLLGFTRQLVWAITGFTAAHSLTLALAALGLVRLPAAPVEAWIALSIVMVSAEALSTRCSLTRRFPLVVPLVIGLIHGLGFAGALSELGLPTAHRFAALLSFNLGVELGQLGVIGLVWLIARAGARISLPAQLRAVVLSFFGSVAGYWTIERMWAMTGL